MVLAPYSSILAAAFDTSLPQIAAQSRSRRPLRGVAAQFHPKIARHHLGSALGAHDVAIAFADPRDILRARWYHA
jgi:hypothetical protein